MIRPIVFFTLLSSHLLVSPTIRYNFFYYKTYRAFKSIFLPVESETKIPRVIWVIVMMVMMVTIKWRRLRYLSIVRTL